MNEQEREKTTSVIVEFERSCARRRNVYMLGTLQEVLGPPSPISVGVLLAGVGAMLAGLGRLFRAIDRLVDAQAKLGARKEEAGRKKPGGADLTSSPSTKARKV